MTGFAQILAGCRPLLTPGGSPGRDDAGRSAAPAPGRHPHDGQPRRRPQAGFTLHERCVALLAAAGDSGITVAASFFQLSTPATPSPPASPPMS